MDLDISPNSVKNCRKRPMELPLKKRYQGHDSSAFSLPTSQLRSNGSPLDDRASDDSALPKTPSSGQSSASLIDVDDCNGYALDFTLPTRARAQSKHQESLKNGHPIDQDNIDHGFESASTSSVTSSVQEEPLDLAHKRLSESIAASNGSFPIGLFGPGLLPFSLGGPIDPNIPHMLYPIFAQSNATTAQMASTALQPPASKRPKLASSKPSKKADTPKSNMDFDLASPLIPTMPQMDDPMNELEDDTLLNKMRRNYKNMTIERRMEANARERTRVHTIGAAFDRLRKLIPSSTSDQKLSKLSILRIACRYIMLLASMNGLDYSLDQHEYSVEECVEMLTDTIHVESKFKRVP